MGRIGISFCDMCGKRTALFAGKMVLSKFVNVKAYSYTTLSQQRTWTLCRKCFGTMASAQSRGDQIAEEIERQLDFLRVAKEDVPLLQVKNEGLKQGNGDK